MESTPSKWSLFGSEGGLIETKLVLESGVMLFLICIKIVVVSLNNYFNKNLKNFSH